MQVRIPDQARAAGGHDAHMTVVDQASGWEYDLWQVTRQAARRRPAADLLGRAHADRRRRSRLGRHGRSLRPPRRHHPGRGDAPRPDRPRTLHAGPLRLGARSYSRQTATDSRAPTGATPRPRGPASSSTSRPPRSPRCGLPDWKKTILRAMSEYGLYVGDTTGGTPWNIWFESGSSYTSFGRRTRWSPSPARRASARSSDGKYYFDWGERHQLAPPPARRGPVRGRAQLLGARPGAGFAPTAQHGDRGGQRQERHQQPPGPGTSGSFQSVSALVTELTVPSSSSSPPPEPAGGDGASRPSSGRRLVRAVLLPLLLAAASLVAAAVGLLRRCRRSRPTSCRR